MEHQEASVKREAEFEAIAEELGLSSEHRAILKTHNQAAYAPYHNAQHNLTVAVNCFKLAQNSSNEHVLRNLFLAGLYHDFDHSLGKLADVFNTDAAARAAEKHIQLIEPKLEAHDLTMIKRFIKQTTYPAILKPAIHEDLVIRDADLLQWAEPDYSYWLDGLASELEKPVTLESTVSFVLHNGFFTPAAMERFRKSELVLAFVRKNMNAFSIN